MWTLTSPRRKTCNTAKFPYNEAHCAKALPTHLELPISSEGNLKYFINIGREIRERNALVKQEQNTIKRNIQRTKV